MPSEPEHKQRWFRITLGRLLGGMLLVEGGLFVLGTTLASNGRLADWLAVAAIAGVGLVLMVAMARFALGILEDHRLKQFSLRALLVTVAICAFAFGLLGRRIEQRRRERQAADAIAKLGGRVMFEYETYDAVHHRSPALETLRFFFGANFLSEVMDAECLDATDDQLMNLAELPQLKRLMVGGTKFTDAGVANLEQLKELNELSLIKTNVSDANLAHLKGLTKLETLFLNDTQITDAGLINLSDLTRLRNLSLAGTNVTGAGLIHLKRLTGLWNLWLDRSKFSDTGSVGLTGVTSLWQLGLSETEITDKGLANFGVLSRIEWLGLFKTKVTQAGIRDLHEMFGDGCWIAVKSSIPLEDNR